MGRKKVDTPESPESDRDLGPPPQRQQIERQWEETVRRALRKGKPPPDLGRPPKKKGRRKN